jgi:hypothetical protein
MQLLAQRFELAAKVESNTVNGVEAPVQIPISLNTSRAMRKLSTAAGTPQ